MVKTVSFKRLILPAVLPQVSLIVVRGPPTFWRSPDSNEVKTTDQVKEITDEITHTDTILASQPFDIINAKFESTASVRATHGRWHRRSRRVLVSGQPSAGSELGDAIDREVSQARQGRAKIDANGI